MKTHFRPLVGGLILAMAMSAAHAQVNAVDLPSFDAPNVYVMSNGINANSVAILKRKFFVGLNEFPFVPTCRKGGAAAPIAPPPEPLGSKNAFLKSQDGRRLFAVNACSNQVS